MTPMEELEYHQVKIPPQRPQKLDAYYNLSPQKQKDAQKDGFFTEDDIKKYLDAKWEAELLNRDAFLRAYELYLEHPEHKSLIISYLKKFKRAIESTPYPYKSLKLNFKEYPFEELDDIEVAWDE